MSEPVRLMISPVQGDGEDDRSMHLNSCRLVFSLTCWTTVKGSGRGEGAKRGAGRWQEAGPFTDTSAARHWSAE